MVVRGKEVHYTVTTMFYYRRLRNRHYMPQKMILRGIAPLKIPFSHFLFKYTAISIPIILGSISNPGVPLVEFEVASGVGVEPATVSESGVATGSTAPVSPTCPSIMKVENPGVGDEY